MGRTRQRSRVSAGSPELHRRETILRAAIEIFAKKGYHGCRISDVAREANVAYGLVYHYFEDKEALLQSVFELAWGAFVEQLSARIQEGQSIEQQISGMIDVAFEAYRKDAKLVKVLILEIGRSPGGSRINRGGAFGQVLTLAAEMFEQAQHRGELRPGADPRLFAALLFGAIEMGLTAFVLGVTPRADDALERARAQVTETFLRGVIGPKEEATWMTGKSATSS